MSDGVSDGCEFVTRRLRVGPWHAVENRNRLDLAEVIAGMLTVRTTTALPEPWRGDFSVERAKAWISERDAESPTLLVTETVSERPVGLVVLADVPLGESSVDVRTGYILAEDLWGQGLATELLAGLIEWARAQPTVHLLTGGVDPKNRASVRVLEKSGFRRVSDDHGDTAIYQLDVDEGNEWDRYAGSWDDDAFARAYASAAFESLQDVQRGTGIILDGSNVLDFGCGTGLLTERLLAAGATVAAVDTSTAMLDVLDDKIVKHGWTRVSTNTELPSGQAEFDLVVCSSVCSFLDDYPGTVKDLAARMRDGGLFVQWDWERTDDDPTGLTTDEIRQALARAGLIDITVGTGFTVTVDDHNMSPLMGHGRRTLDPTTDPRSDSVGSP